MSDYIDDLSKKDESISYSDNLLFDRDMEEALIGSILINPDILVDVMSFLSAEDFFLSNAMPIFGTLLFTLTRTITILTL